MIYIINYYFSAGTCFNTLLYIFVRNLINSCQYINGKASIMELCCL